MTMNHESWVGRNLRISAARGRFAAECRDSATKASGEFLHRRAWRSCVRQRLVSRRGDPGSRAHPQELVARRVCASVARRTINSCNEEKGAPQGAPFKLHRKYVTCAMFGRKRLRRVVHLVFDRMRGVLEADHFRHLQVDVAVDEVVVEHAAGLEELAVLVEFFRAPGAANRTPSGSASARPAADRRDPCPSPIAGIELVLDAVEAGHQHRGKAEIGIGERIGEAHLDALGLRVGRCRGCGTRPSGCAPSRRAAPAPRSPAPDACRSWWSGW